MTASCATERDGRPQARRVAEALGRLIGYLRTWQNPDGLLGGTIATWWSSTLETAVPHPMNQYPVIQGFLELRRGGVGGGDWLAEARRIGDGLAGSIQPDGLMSNCWGDIPGKGTGTVIFAGPALALAELHAACGEPRYLQAAQRLLQTIEARWTMHRLNRDGVVNQGLKWAEAMLAFAAASARPDYRDWAVHVGRAYLEHQIPSGPQRGGFYQSRTDDRLISVYQGKCLAPLIRLYESTGDEAFLRSAVLLARYLLRQAVEPGVFVNYRWPHGRPRTPVHHVLRRTDLAIFRRTIPTYRLWRSLPTDWGLSRHPSFVARAADSIRGLLLAAGHEPGLRAAAEDLVGRLLSFQLPHGGFPNTVGFFGDPGRSHWQDVCCPTRWNAYAMCLLATHAAGLRADSVPHGDAAHAYSVAVGARGDQRYTETADAVEVTDNDAPVARLEKPSGRSAFLAEGWAGDLSGPRCDPKEGRRGG